MTDYRKCLVVRAGKASEGVTGVSYGRAISAETVGAKGLCLEIAIIPPGARARAHFHEGHESAAYVLKGQLVLWFGEGLRERVDAKAGDFIFIPPGVPHLPANLSDTEPVEAVLARTDPNEQENAVPLPHLDQLLHLAHR